MIVSGRGGIVLYRKTFAKEVNQPRLIAGLIAALCEFSVGSEVGVPVNTIELENFTVSVVEVAVNELEEDDRDCLRAILFHDTCDVRADN